MEKCGCCSVTVYSDGSSFFPTDVNLSAPGDRQGVGVQVHHEEGAAKPPRPQARAPSLCFGVEDSPQ
jgi:hypothetical protein